MTHEEIEKMLEENKRLREALKLAQQLDYHCCCDEHAGQRMKFYEICEDIFDKKKTYSKQELCHCNEVHPDLDHDAYWIGFNTARKALEDK